MILDRLTITLPWPDPKLMPNRKNGRHWGVTQFQKEQARSDGYYAAQNALGRDSLNRPERIPLKITFAAPDRRGRDIDNLLSSLKHSLDGIALGLGVNDKQFRPLSIDVLLDADKKGFVLVEIGG